tara:strand:- start:2321 stop:2662 length:342 start_codon:yes stop_codon:yes gene_type:complete
MPGYGARPPKYRDVSRPDPVKCVGHRCKNMAERKTPEGEPVCRTHLARRNMFGAVDAKSPTIPSVGRGNEDKNGFGYVSPKSEMRTGSIEMFRKGKIEHKFKKSYADFVKDSR